MGISLFNCVVRFDVAQLRKSLPLAIESVAKDKSTQNLEAVCCSMLLISTGLCPFGDAACKSLTNFTNCSGVLAGPVYHVSGNILLIISCCLTLSPLASLTAAYIFHISKTLVASLNEIPGAYQNACLTSCSFCLTSACATHASIMPNTSFPSSFISSRVVFFCGVGHVVGMISGGLNIDGAGAGTIGVDGCMLCVQAGSKSCAACITGEAATGVATFVHAQNSTGAVGACNMGLIVVATGGVGNVMGGCHVFVPACDVP